MLPEECLWLIVSYLSQERATLHSLLLTSRVFFRISVSFLYTSPFRLLHNEPNQHWTIVERTRRYDNLLHLLISSSHLLQDNNEDHNHTSTTLHQETRTDRPHAPSRLPPYGPEVQLLPSPTTVDYLSCCTNMFHDPMMHQTFMTLFPTIPNCYYDNVVWYRSMVEVRNRIELAMLDRLAPQLTTLAVCLPMQVPRIKLPYLSSLRRLEILGTDHSLFTDADLESEKLMILANPPRSSHTRATPSRLDKMLMFIMDHQATFGTLRELQIENKPESELSNFKQPSRLIELVEAMGDNLEVLDVQHWPEAVFYMDRIPVKNLKILLLHSLKNPEQIFRVSGNMQTFLGSCSRLQGIKMYVNNKDVFDAWRPKWTTTLSTTPQHGQQRLDHSHMTLLTRIDLAGLAERVIAATNEAVELFGPTLEHITVRSWFNGSLVSTPLSWSGPSLTRLASLDLEGEVAWTFVYSSLLHCPTLARIRLAFTAPMPSRSSRKRPAIDHICQLPNLRELDLLGLWGTLAFRGWPEVISRLQRLERLDLVGCQDMKAEQVVQLVKDILSETTTTQQQSNQEEKEQSQLEPHYEDHQGQEANQSGTDLLLWQYYNQSQLRWVIVSKQLEDNIRQLWQRHLLQSSPVIRAQQKQVRFTYVALARPSR
ncbi:hypothetical protein BGZ94_009480 [Podila epigama]|nr:hypothetical protein BGZ94_009480 [Podila epigama]